jgi:hypothetical protein
MVKAQSATTSMRRNYAGFTQTGTSSKYSRSTMLLAILFVVGLGWMIYLASQVVPYAPTNEEVQKDALPKIGLQDMQSSRVAAEGFAERISAFHYDASLRQMPIETFSRDPFLHLAPQIAIVKPNETVPVKVPKGPTKPIPEDPKAPATDGFKLSMILIMGGKPEAIISGKVVNVGTPVGGWIVERIESSTVTLRWNEQRHVLKMNLPEEGNR